MRYKSTRRFWSKTVLALALSTCCPMFGSEANDAVQPQLNVVFHGMFVFVRSSDHVEVIAPDVGDHVYKAGTWGKERRLKQGLTYSLAGVSSGTTPLTLDPASHVVLSGVQSIDRSPSKVFCVLNLPLPDQVIGLRRAKPAARRPVFAGKAADIIKTTSFPLVETLVYRIADMQKLSIGQSFDWTPELPAQKVVNLHVWAEPEIEMETGHDATAHPSQAFNQLMTLFPGVDLRIEFGAGAVVDAKTNVRGLEPWEESTLRERSQLILPARPKSKNGTKGAEIDNCISIWVP